MNVSAWSIRNPVPAILLFVMLTFVGFLGLRGLGIQNFPDIELPIVIVSASLEGAAPGQLETEVARKIEDGIASVGGIKHTYTTITDGIVMTYVEFNIDKNADEALNEVRNAVDTIRSDLPAEMTNPVISKMTTVGLPLLTYTVQSPSMNEQELSWFIDNDLSKVMLSVKGVGKVSRIGGVTREVHIDLDPVQMTGLGVTAIDISNSLKHVQQDASGGRGDIGGTVQSVRTLGAVATIEQIATLDIPLSDGRTVRLNQVAHVHDSIADRTGYALLDGKPVVAFDVTRSKGASEVSVAQAVRKAVGKFSAEHPQVTVHEAFNTVTSVEDNYSGSMQLLYEGAILAILVVWLFLRDWRATLVSAAALPLSIIPTFAVMYFADFSLNVLTLLALALVVGILVDDAIVEIENIVRHLRMGKSPYQAAMEAADEIGLAVIATTFTLIAVFLPTAFMGGIAGKFFRQFGMTASVAIAASLLVARLLTPMMAAYILKPHHDTPPDSRFMTHYLGWVRGCLTHRKSTVLAALLFFIGSLALVPLLPTGFVPTPDLSQTKVTLELQPGSTIEDSHAMAEQARQVLMKNQYVKHVFTSVGVGGGTMGMFDASTNSNARMSTLTVDLTHRTERSLKQPEIEAQLRNILNELPGVRVTLSTGNSGERLQLILVSDNPATLQDTGRQLEKELRTLHDVGNITSSASLQRPEIQITPNYARTADLGITSASLASVIRVATYGDFETVLPKLNLPQRQIPIRVRLDEGLRHDLTALAQLRVPSNSGSIPLDTVADIRLGGGPAQIDRLDRTRKLEIDVELNGRPLSAVMSEVAKLPTMQNLPAGVKQVPLGDEESMQELFESFGLAMAIGVLCIYVVLVLLFHDFLQPITILTALPLSVGGAFIALLITRNSFSMPSVIGLLMLMGVVTKNSILLVEYAVMARREHGLSRFDAIMDACHKRARPILMTTIAMGAGMLPIAIGIGADPSFRAPMAIAVIGGLITSTFLSLLVIPVAFTYVDDILIRFKKLTMKKQRTEEKESM